MSNSTQGLSSKKQDWEASLVLTWSVRDDNIFLWFSRGSKGNKDFPKCVHVPSHNGLLCFFTAVNLCSWHLLPAPEHKTPCYPKGTELKVGTERVYFGAKWMITLLIIWRGSLTSLRCHTQMTHDIIVACVAPSWAGSPSQVRGWRVWSPDLTGQGPGSRLLLLHLYLTISAQCWGLLGVMVTCLSASAVTHWEPLRTGSTIDMDPKPLPAGSPGLGRPPSHCSTSTGQTP